jgi:hypothetical protein
MQRNSVLQPINSCSNTKIKNGINYKQENSKKDFLGEKSLNYTSNQLKV